MPTKAVKERKSLRRTRGSRSNAENHLRRELAVKKKIKSPEDDEGLYKWLCNLHKGKDDHRSLWESALEARLKKELKF